MRCQVYSVSALREKIKNEVARSSFGDPARSGDERL